MNCKGGLIFDLDGTLIDSCEGIFSALRFAFTCVSVEMPAIDLRPFIGPPITRIAKSLCPDLSDHQLAEIERHYRVRYDDEDWRGTRLYPDVLENLLSLCQQFRLFITTNKPRIPTMKVLEHLGIGGLFLEVVTKDSRQPAYATKSEMVLDLMDRHAVDRTKSFLVGDTEDDCRAAECAGLEFVFASYGYGAAQAPRAISNFNQLVAILNAEVLNVA